MDSEDDENDDDDDCLEPRSCVAIKTRECGAASFAGFIDRRNAREEAGEAEEVRRKGGSDFFSFHGVGMVAGQGKAWRGVYEAGRGLGTVDTEAKSGFRCRIQMRYRYERGTKGRF